VTGDGFIFVEGTLA